MPKRGLGKNVLQAAKERIAWTFDNFDRVYTSFSGGKDSTVMLHLVMEEAGRRNRKVGLLFVDLEGQYQATVRHVRRCFELYADSIEPFWVCLPLSLRNAVSVYEPKWTCWEREKKGIWIREQPRDSLTEEAAPDWFQPGMEFEEFVPLFGEWYAKGESTACFVGIRSDESLNRYRTIASKAKARVAEKPWTSVVTDNVANVYPIYDWRTSDIWAWHGKNPSMPYNRLYDQMAKAGLTVHQMRICQPYGDDQRRGLWLFHLIEPDSWARVVARVNGANSGALYNQEWGNVNGYRRITKPEGHTWKSFAELLISSMPPPMEEHYRHKIILFQKWWVERGYPDGVPDEAPYELEAARKVPSWRRVCKSLLRNDYWCKGLGFSQHKSGAYHKYQDLMRRRLADWGMEDRLAYSEQLELVD